MCLCVSLIYITTTTEQIRNLLYSDSTVLDNELLCCMLLQVRLPLRWLSPEAMTKQKFTFASDMYVSIDKWLIWVYYW